MNRNRSIADRASHLVHWACALTRDFRCDISTIIAASRRGSTAPPITTFHQSAPNCSGKVWMLSPGSEKDRSSDKEMLWSCLRDRRATLVSCVVEPANPGSVNWEVRPTRQTKDVRPLYFF